MIECHRREEKTGFQADKTVLYIQEYPVRLPHHHWQQINKTNHKQLLFLLVVLPKNSSRHLSSRVQVAQGQQEQKGWTRTVQIEQIGPQIEKGQD